MTTLGYPGGVERRCSCILGDIRVLGNIGVLARGGGERGVGDWRSSMGGGHSRGTRGKSVGCTCE